MVMLIENGRQVIIVRSNAFMITHVRFIDIKQCKGFVCNYNRMIGCRAASHIMFHQAFNIQTRRQINGVGMANPIQKQRNMKTSPPLKLGEKGKGGRGREAPH